MPTKVLVLGYGNVDRQDDGVAWHILSSLSNRFGVAIQEVDCLGDTPTDQGTERPIDEDRSLSSIGRSLTLMFTLQLTPEMAEVLTQYQMICFVDAHTGNVPEELQFIELEPQFQSSPFTHHLTPQSLLVMAKTLYGISPQGRLVSVRGYEFGFDQSLSPATQALAESAAAELGNWLNSLLA